MRNIDSTNFLFTPFTPFFRYYGGYRSYLFVWIHIEVASVARSFL
jgi:hypothetical protein